MEREKERGEGQEETDRGERERRGKIEIKLIKRVESGMKKENRKEKE